MWCVAASHGQRCTSRGRRPAVVEVVLEAAAAADLAVQRRAVALVKNMLFMNAHHCSAVTARVTPP